MNSRNPSTGVILLNWNTADETMVCIRSLLEGSVVPSRIVVFDNGSTDGSPEKIEAAFPRDITLLRSPSNLGFAAANNRAADHLLREGIHYLWILNNDTKVHPDCLKHLLEELIRRDDVAAACGKILFMDTPNIIQYAGAFWKRWTLRASFRGLGEADQGQYETPCDVGMLSGCCMFIRGRVWQTIGGFRENYFIYNEDTEWSLRAIRSGLRLRYVPQAVLWHTLHASMRKNYGRGFALKAPPQQEYLQTRNSIFLNREHARFPFERIASLTDNLARRLYRACGLLVLGRWRSSVAILRGLWDGFRLPYR
jgi:GT2 family glycosyltransferase